MLQPLRARARAAPASASAPTLRPPAGRARSSSSRPASCIVSVDAPRVREFQAVAQAPAASGAPVDAAVGPEAAVLAEHDGVAQRRRDVGQRHPGPAAHALVDAHGLQPAPWRSSSGRSDGACAARTASKAGAASAGVAASAAASADCGAATPASRRHLQRRVGALAEGLGRVHRLDPRRRQPEAAGGVQPQRVLDDVAAARQPVVVARQASAARSS